MKLHALQLSNNCRRVMATADHLGIPLDLVNVDLMAGQNRTPEYLALNPNAKVPTLELDDGTSLWESNAIMQYLASTKPGNTLWPDDALARANIARWQFWDANHLSTGTGPLVFERLFKPMFMKQQPDEQKIAEALERWKMFGAILDAQLGNHDYVAGDQLTLADFSVGASFSWAGPSQLPLDGFANIQAWLARMDEVPAWKNSAPKM